MNKLGINTLEIEKKILATLIWHPVSYDSVNKYIMNDEFFDYEQCKIVYGAIEELRQKQEFISASNITVFLNMRLEGCSREMWRKVAEVITADYFNNTMLLEMVLYKLEMRRRKLLMDTTYQISEKLAKTPINDSSEVNKDIDKLVEVKEREIIKGKMTINDIVMSTIELVDKMQSGQISNTFISTGYYKLDNIIGGYKPKELIVIGARPGRGKSALGVKALNSAIMQGKKTAYFNMEMSSEEITIRLSAINGLSLTRLNQKDGMRDNDWKLLNEVMSKINDSKTTIVQDVFDLYEITEKCRKLKSTEGLDMIIIDHIGLITTKNGKSRYEIMTEISRELKLLTMELGIPVIAMSQLSRANTQNGFRMPRLSDLRDSGSIEQDANVVIFCHFYDDNEIPPGQIDNGEIIVAKSRNTATGSFNCNWVGYRAMYLDKTDGFM